MYVCMYIYIYIYIHMHPHNDNMKHNNNNDNNNIVNIQLPYLCIITYVEFYSCVCMYYV